MKDGKAKKQRRFTVGRWMKEERVRAGEGGDITHELQIVVFQHIDCCGGGLLAASTTVSVLRYTGGDGTRAAGPQRGGASRWRASSTSAGITSIAYGSGGREGTAVVGAGQEGVRLINRRHRRKNTTLLTLLLYPVILILAVPGNNYQRHLLKKLKVQPLGNC